MLVLKTPFTISAAISVLLSVQQLCGRRGAKMNWARQHLRDHLRDVAPKQPKQNILNFPDITPGVPKPDASVAFGFMSEAAAMIEYLKDRAAESEGRAKALTESAFEKLQLAESRIQTAEADRDRAQDQLSRVCARLGCAERELTRTQSRIATAEVQLANAEKHMKAAEARANKAEKAVSEIEDAIRTQLVGLQVFERLRDEHGFTSNTRGGTIRAR